MGPILFLGPFLVFLRFAHPSSTAMSITKDRTSAASLTIAEGGSPIMPGSSLQGSRGMSRCLSEVPSAILHQHMVPFLSVTDLRSLISSSKAAAGALQVPLGDLSFRRFACIDHDLFIFHFQQPNGDGVPNPEPSAAAAVVGRWSVAVALVRSELACTPV